MTTPPDSEDVEHDDDASVPDDETSVVPAVPAWLQRALYGAGITIGVLIGLVVVGLVIATGLMLWFGTKLPAKTNPSALDMIFHSRSVVFAVRAAIIAAAGYVIYSIVHLTSRGRPLTQLGPVKVAEPAQRAQAEAEELLDALASQIDENQALEDRLDERDQLLEQLLEHAEELEAQLEQERARADS